MRLSTVLLFVPVLSGCDSFTGPGPLDFRGTYTLIAIDGAALPAPIIDSESSTEVNALSGWLRLDPEVPGFMPEFTLSLTWRTSDPGGSTVDSAAYLGSYLRRAGNRFHLRFEGNRALCPPGGCGFVENGSYADSEFEFQGNPAAFTFRKR